MIIRKDSCYNEPNIQVFGRFEHDVVLLILIFIAWKIVQGLSVKAKESGFSLVSFVFPGKFEQVFAR